MGKLVPIEKSPSRLATARAIFKNTGKRTIVFHPPRQIETFALREGLTPSLIAEATGIHNPHLYGIQIKELTDAGQGSVSSNTLQSGLQKHGTPAGFVFYRPTDPSNLSWLSVTLPWELESRYRAAISNAMLARIVAEESDGEVLFRSRIGFALEGLPPAARIDMFAYYLTRLFGSRKDYALAKDLATIVAVELFPLREGRLRDREEFLEPLEAVEFRHPDF